MVHGLMAIDGHKSAIGVFTGIIQDGHQERTVVAQRLSRSMSASTSDLYFGDFVKVLEFKDYPRQPLVVCAGHRQCRA